jgi:hypothetical protein
MWADNTTVETSHARAEDHSSPSSIFHLRQAQLGHEKCRAAVGTPGMLELLDTDFGDRLDAAFQYETSVIEEDSWVSQAFHYLSMKCANLVSSETPYQIWIDGNIL